MAAKTVSSVVHTLANVPPAATAYTLADLALNYLDVTIAVVESDRVAAHYAQEVATFAPDLSVLTFPAWDVTPYDRAAPSAHITAARQNTLAAVTAHKAGTPLLILTTPAALATKLLPAQKTPLTLKLGQDYAREELLKNFVALGFNRQDVVTDVAEFTTRGAIIDIFPPLAAHPIRLEFFDTELESIRPFNPLTQRTIAHETPPKSMTLTAANPLDLNEDAIGTFRQSWRETFHDTQAETYTQISDGIMPSTAQHYLPLFSTEPLMTLFDAAPKAQLILTPNANDAADNFQARLREAYAFRQESIGKRTTPETYFPLPPERLYLEEDSYTAELKKHAVTQLSPFKADVKKGIMNALLVEHLLPTKPQQAAKMAAELCVNQAQAGHRIILTAPTQSALLRLNKTLEDLTDKLPTTIEVKTWAETQKHKASLLLSLITHGFSDTQNKITLITDQDIYGEKIGGVARSGSKHKASDAQKFSHFSELSIGDFVVHEDHGIGRFDALLTMETPHANGKTLKQDFLKLTYADEARLFVPVEALDVLSRFKAGDIHGVEEGETATVQLDKLGGTSWQTRKARVKENLMEMAKHLMATAAAREVHSTKPHPAPDSLYDEFCASFPHRLTADQARTMDEVQADLTAPKPMDRLVVGDVGFGKTEVAVRAAFIAAAGGKQVAITVPTTLLARQHADVFRQRFQNFPFTVATLSRLVSPKVAAKTKADLAAGKIDIIVGTHALLSDSIKFKDLGLLVIDEEQRFGVKHKEKLKTLKDTVDVLTLTATPIPRTLHMGLSGLKTLSTITTPPVDRLAINTLISPWDAKAIRESLMRELYRGGQAYIVTPLVRDIPRLEEKIKAIVPEATIQTAHGQMTPTELENVMEAFYENKFNVLIATTIVESGLDVKNANTLLVHRADRFGLAQLYQLRGRVGRGTAQGYATFFLPEGPITPDGMKRLQVLQKLDGLGAGFLIANYDMDIRGFGNLVGKQQSGQIREIGAELYGKLLKEAVNTLKRRQKNKLAVSSPTQDAPEIEAAHFTPTLNLGLTYLLPEEYIPHQTDRLTLYRRLANLETADEIADFKADLADRFGPPPAEATHLLDVLTIRNTCKNLNIEKLDAGPRGITLHFYQKTFAHPMNLLKLIQTNAGIITLNPDQSVSFNTPTQTDSKRLAQTQKVLAKLEDLVND